MKVAKLLLIIFLIGNLSIYCQDLADASKASGLKTNSLYNLTKANFEYNVVSYSGQIHEISVDMAGNHVFGEEAAKKVYLVDDMYTYEVPVSPGNPTTKRMIQKPVIYSAVKKIEKQLKKDVRVNKTDFNTASMKFNKVLEVAICIFNADTQYLEEKIKKISTTNELISIFTDEIQLNFLN